MCSFSEKSLCNRGGRRSVKVKVCGYSAYKPTLSREMYLAYYNDINIY